MRSLLPACVFCSLILAPLSGADVSAEPTSTALTPAALTSTITAAVQARRVAWVAPLDRDRDRRVSRLEVLAACAGAGSWMRRNFPTEFKAIDRNHDNAVSRAELTTFAARDEEVLFDIQPRKVSVMGRANPAAPTPSLSVGRASVYFGGQQAYIQDYDVVNGQYDPVIGVLSYGTGLEVSDVVITTRRR